MGEILHNERGIRRALDDYKQYKNNWDKLRVLTKAMYDLLDEAVEGSDLSDDEFAVVNFRWLESEGNESTPLERCAEALGISRRTVINRSNSAITKIHSYMEKEGREYYALYNIRL